MATTSATIRTERIYRAEGLRLSAFLCDDHDDDAVASVCCCCLARPRETFVYQQIIQGVLQLQMRRAFRL